MTSFLEDPRNKKNVRNYLSDHLNLKSISRQKEKECRALQGKMFSVYKDHVL